MPYVSKSSKVGTVTLTGCDVVLSEDLLDLLAERIAARVTAQLCDRAPAAARQQGWSAPIAPPAPELRPGALYTIRYVTQWLHVSRGTVYRLARRGDLELVKIGRISRVTSESLRALIERDRDARRTS